MIDWVYRRPPRIVRKRNPNWRLIFAATVATIGVAEESDSAFSIAAIGGLPAADIATEIDISLGVDKSKDKLVGLSVENDFSLSVNVFGVGGIVQLSIEVNASLPAIVNQSHLVGLATESDSVLALTPVKELDALKGIELDAANAIIVGVSPILLLTDEFDTALSIAVKKAITPITAVEDSIAFGVSSGDIFFVGLSEEVDTALDVSPSAAQALGLNVEFDSAQVTIARRNTLAGLVTESDSAFVATPSLFLVPVDLGWEDDDVTWGGIELGSKDFAPVILDGAGFKILGFDPTAPLDVFLERKSVVNERGAALLGLSVWPQIIGPTGEIIKISLGGHETPDGAIDYEGPYDFIIGQDTFVDFAVAGKYLAIRFESIGVPVWTLQSFDIAYEIIGRH